MLTFAFAFDPRLEPLLPAKDDLADALPTFPLIAVCCNRRNGHSCCAREVKAFVSECSVESECLVYRMGEDGRMGKQSRDCAAKLALKDRQQLEGELSLHIENEDGDCSSQTIDSPMR